MSNKEIARVAKLSVAAAPVQPAPIPAKDIVHGTPERRLHLSNALRISRRFSQRSVMEAIVQGGPISRASIAKQTGLSKQTISEIVTASGAGRVGAGDRPHQRPCRAHAPSPTSSSTNAAYIVAVDLGGTKVRVALTDLACQIFAEDVAPTDHRGGQFIVDQIVAMTFRAAAAAAHCAREDRARRDRRARRA